MINHKTRSYETREDRCGTRSYEERRVRVENVGVGQINILVPNVSDQRVGVEDDRMISDQLSPESGIRD